MDQYCICVKTKYQPHLPSTPLKLKADVCYQISFIGVEQTSRVSIWNVEIVIPLKKLTQICLDDFVSASLAIKVPTISAHISQKTKKGPKNDGTKPSKVVLFDTLSCPII